VVPFAHEEVAFGLNLGFVAYAAQVLFACGFIVWVYREAWRRFKDGR
jgi:hypothetical protein